MKSSTKVDLPLPLSPTMASIPPCLAVCQSVSRTKRMSWLMNTSLACVTSFLNGSAVNWKCARAAGVRVCFCRSMSVSFSAVDEVALDVGAVVGRSAASFGCAGCKARSICAVSAPAWRSRSVMAARSSAVFFFGHLPWLTRSAKVPGEMPRSRARCAWRMPTLSSSRLRGVVRGAAITGTSAAQPRCRRACRWRPARRSTGRPMPAARCRPGTRP